MSNMKRKYAAVGQHSLLMSIMIYALLLAGLVLFIFPVYWMISTSLKHPPDIYSFPPKWFNFPIRWQNYADIFTLVDFHLYLKNTVLYTASVIIGTVFSSSMVAFGFARLRARGSIILFAIVLGTMMLPYQVTMVPQYLLFNKLGWTDSYLPLIVPSFAGSAFAIFLLRQFFMGIPKELDEAVKIDGGGFWTTYFRMILPLSVPSLATIAILEFISRWNDLMGPLIYIDSQSNFPVSLGLANFTAAFGQTPWHLLMAASTVAITPPLVIFFFTQKYFIRGIVISGSKG